ncbi:hypothetical protein DTO282F9_2252 [Paecilomyces variotii]|nr:hypothetical protein DTO282F9_2252 [Paecilomyces variotii]
MGRWRISRSSLLSAGFSSFSGSASLILVAVERSCSHGRSSDAKLNGDVPAAVPVVWPEKDAGVSDHMDALDSLVVQAAITLPMESTMHVVRPNVEKKRLSRSEADPASSSPGSLNRTAIIATPGRSSLRDATPNANRFL